MAQHIAGFQGAAALHVFTDKAEGLLEPLLEEDEDSSTSSDERSMYSNSTSSTISVKVKQTAGQLLKTAAVCTAVGLGSAASVALRHLNNKLREEADQLEKDVDELSEEIGLLQPEAERIYPIRPTAVFGLATTTLCQVVSNIIPYVTRLVHLDRRANVIEEELRDIVGEQHGNVDKMVGLARENEWILDQMQDNLRQRIVQDVLKIVMMSDVNNDGRFCKVETKMLCLKISLQLQEYGVEFDEGKFYRVMSGDPSVAKTISIVKRLIPSLNENEDDSIQSEGEDEDDDTWNMFQMSSQVSGLSGCSDYGGSEEGGGGSPRGRSLSIVKQKTFRYSLSRRTLDTLVRDSYRKKKSDVSNRSHSDF
ncbi:hypothetical protein ACHAXR_013309 [Thalassiosira sp. AJA248-18]